MKDKGLAVTPKIIVQLLIVVVLIPLLPLLITWRWNWWEAWAYALTTIIGFVGSRWLANRRNPDLLEERASALEHDDAEPWDRVLAPLVALGSGLIPLIAGVEALWTPGPVYGLGVKVIALIVLVAAWCALAGPRVAAAVVVAGVAVGLLAMHLVTLQMVSRRTTVEPV